MADNEIINPKFQSALLEIAEVVKKYPEHSRETLTRLLVERLLVEVHTTSSDAFPGLRG